MELILWRHADAEPGSPDLARRLTPLGLEQAARMAQWLRGRLPADAVVVASPAVRAQQTAAALGLPVRTEPALAPGASVQAIAAAGQLAKCVVLVGHQPDLGRAAAWLMTGTAHEWDVEKAAAWWLSGSRPARLRAVASADLL